MFHNGLFRYEKSEIMQNKTPHWV